MVTANNSAAKSRAPLIRAQSILEATAGVFIAGGDGGFAEVSETGSGACLGDRINHGTPSGPTARFQ